MSTCRGGGQRGQGTFCFFDSAHNNSSGRVTTIVHDLLTICSSFLSVSLSVLPYQLLCTR